MFNILLCGGHTVPMALESVVQNLALLLCCVYLKSHCSEHVLYIKLYQTLMALKRLTLFQS